MELKYSVTPDHMRDYFRYVYRHSSTLRRARLVNLVLAAFVLVVCYVFLYRYEYALPVWYWAVLSVFLFILVDFYSRSWYLRNAMRMYRERIKDAELRKGHLEITDSCLIGRSDSGDGKLTWEGIDRIVELDSYTFVFMNRLDAIVIPREAIEQGDYRAFVNQLMRRHGRTRPNQPESPTV